MAIRVLIVDDTDHVRNMLSHMLTLDGFDVVGATGGASEAIGALGQAAPDIVIMDLKMPIMDGIAATRVIRHDHPTLPIRGTPHERAAAHSITSSARASSVGGTSRPSTLAVPHLFCYLWP